MKALKIILVILIILVGGYAIWMATISPTYEVTRSAVIETSPEKVYATVSDFESWKDWSKWHQMDPDMKITYGEKKSGEGASYSWDGEEAGSGTQTITAALPNKRLETHVSFKDQGESDGYWEFESTDEGHTEVTWGFTGEMPFFLRIMNLRMDEMVGKDFEEGLANLKDLLEAEAAAAPEVAIELVDVEAMPYYGIRHEISWSEMSPEFFEENYSNILAYLAEDAQNMLMPPMAIYYVWDEENQTTVMEPAIAAESEKPGNDQVTKGLTWEGKALKAIHMGPYDKTGEAHEALGAHMKKNGYDYPEGAGVWEVYVTDPGEEPDTAQWVTEIYYPVKTSTEAKKTKKAKKAEKAD